MGQKKRNQVGWIKKSPSVFRFLFVLIFLFFARFDSGGEKIKKPDVVSNLRKHLQGINRSNIYTVGLFPTDEKIFNGNVSTVASQTKHMWAFTVLSYVINFRLVRDINSTSKGSMRRSSVLIDRYSGRPLITQELKCSNPICLNRVTESLA